MLFRRRKPKPTKENIFIIGPMGAGKTTVGHLLAKALRCPFYDSDKEIEVKTGATIPLIFELEGEEGFRKREISVIDELTQLFPIVLSTGGGAILNPENRQHLKARGKVVYLSTSIDQILNRTAHDRNRPLLQTGNPRAKLEEIMSVREPLYREIADVVVATDKHKVRDVVNEILRSINRGKSGHRHEDWSTIND